MSGKGNAARKESPLEVNDVVQDEIFDDEKRDTLSDLPDFKSRMKRHNASGENVGRDVRGNLSQLADTLPPDAFTQIINGFSTHRRETVALFSQMNTQ